MLAYRLFHDINGLPLSLSFLPPSLPSLNPLPGRAIKHVKESIFTPEGGARRGVPKVLVVLTDGRSQDDVNTVSKEMQVEGGWGRGEPKSSDPKVGPN